MRIIRDERRIKLLSSVGRYATLAGLAVLLIGLVISFVRPTWMLALVVSMMLGFILSVVGGYFADRYAGPLAHHKALAEVLKGLDYRHTLIEYLLPADHVLLEPGGCTCFVVKTQGGEVRYENEEKRRWTHKERGKLFRQLVGQDALGSPDLDVQEEVAKLERYLGEEMDRGKEVPVRGAVVFVNEDVQVEAEEAPVPVFYRKKVKDWLRGSGELKPLPEAVQEELRAALGVTAEGASEEV
ncbi:MAG: nuclease-related domain-containing protein [Anaerolineae bacterium]